MEGEALFRALEEALEATVREGEFPDALAEEVREVARTPERYGGESWLVEILLMQVSEFSVYAETGCCKFAYDHEDVARTLRQLRERVAAA